MASLQFSTLQENSCSPVHGVTVINVLWRLRYFLGLIVNLWMSKCKYRKYFCFFMSHKLLEIIKDLPNCSHDNSYKVVCICRWYFGPCPQVKTFLLCKVWWPCPRRWIVTLQCLQGNCLVSICAPMSLIHTMFYHIVWKQISP